MIFLLTLEKNIIKDNTLFRLLTNKHFSGQAIKMQISINVYIFLFILIFYI